MEELTRGQKAARTRAANKAKKEAKAREIEAEIKAEIEDSAFNHIGVSVDDLVALQTVANQTVETAEKAGLVTAQVTFAATVNGVDVSLTLINGRWLVTL